MFKKFSLIVFIFSFLGLALFWGRSAKAILDSSIIGTYTMNTGNTPNPATSSPFNIGDITFSTNNAASSDASAPCVGTPLQQDYAISANNSFTGQSINGGYTFSWDINHHGDADTGSWNRMNVRIIFGKDSSSTGRSMDLQMAYANGKVTLSKNGDMPAGSFTTNNNLNFVKNSWTRYTFVVESTKISFYIDGSLDKVYTYSDPFDFTTYNTLGNFYFSTGSGIYGSVENWTLFNRPLSTAEITNAAGECFNSSVSFTYCGDGICNNNETCSGCVADCGQCEGGVHPLGVVGTYTMNTGNSGSQYTNPTSTPFNLGALTFNTYNQIASSDASAPCAGTPIQQSYNISGNNSFSQQNINGGYTFSLDVNHHGDADTGSWNRLGGRIIFGYTNSTLGRSLDLNMNYASGKVTFSNGGNLPSGSWTTNNQLSIIKNSWTRYTFIVESTKISFYIDGALDKVYTYASPFDFNTYNQLGYFYSNFAGLYGAVENWTLFNRPLSTTEITEAHNQCFNSNVSFAYCGDGYCNNNETCSGCSADCGLCEGIPHPTGIIGTYIMNTGNSGSQYTNPTSTPFNIGNITFSTNNAASSDASAPCAGTPIQQDYRISANNSFSHKNINGGYTFSLDVNHHGDADTGSWNRLGGRIIFGYTNSALGRSFDLNMNYASGKVTLSNGGNLPSGSWTINNQLSIIKNSWTRYTFIVESTKISFYIDGSLDKVYTYRSPFDFNTYNQLGYFYSNFAGLYGAVENWSLFNRPLSMAEITEADDRCFDNNFSFSYCGDSTCNGTETCSICAADCGQCDGMVHSISAGGSWNDASTWVGGMIPVSTDIVEINGIVEVTGDISIAGLAVSNNATLQNHSSGSQRLIVNGDVINNGTIQSSYAHDFYLTISGNITNNGAWSNGWTDLASIQNRFINGTTPISSPVTFLDSFEISNSPIFNGYVYFNEKIITISSSTQSITLGAGVTLSGSIAGQGSLVISGDTGISGTTTASTIIFDAGSSRFSGNYTADNIIISGSGNKEIDADTVFNGSLTVEYGATLQNYSSGSQRLTIEGDIVNNGTIRDDSSDCYDFYLSIFGDIANNGTWNNFETRIAWPFVFGATEYEVNITEDEDNWPNAFTTADTTYDISNLINSSRYWRVRPSGGYWLSIKRINAGLFGGFTFNTIDSLSQMATRPIELTISAVDVNGNPYSYSGLVSLSASNNGTTTPSTITMSNGNWTGTTSISMFGDNVTLAATGGGESGTSNSFNLKKKPVIIVPGIIGTRLRASTSPYSEIWPNVGSMVTSLSDDYLDELMLNNGGWPATSSVVTTGDIIREITVAGFNQGHYFDQLIDLLEDNGYAENENLFVLPYDWRLDINYIADNTLRNAINEVKQQNNVSEVDVVAHSMGGLVVEKYIQDYPQSSIDKFIDIATPHLGSPSAAKTLLYGDNFDFNKFFGLIGLSSNKIKEISLNFPSVYQLLPSQNYFYASSSIFNSYIVDSYDVDNNNITGTLNYDESIDYLTNMGANSTLAALNDDLHDDLDSFDPNDYGIKAYNIIGCNNPTIGWMEIINQHGTSTYEYGLHYTNGDGTVPLESAESLDNTVGTYFNATNDADGTHALIPSFNGNKQLINAILNSTSTVSFDFSSYPNIHQDDSYCTLNGWEISYHSPIALHIYDEHGRHIGPDEKGNIEINIPGASYDIIGDNKFAFVPKGHNYKIVGQATGLGHFNARIQDVQDGKIVSIAYYNEVPIKSLGTNIEIDFTNNKPNYEMKIDRKGDKVFRDKIKPSSILNAKEAEDRTKPETMAEINNQTMKLTSSDNNSKVLKTEYSLDKGKTWNIYTKAIDVSQLDGATIQYKSTDRAGNIEIIQEQAILIDKDTSRPELSSVKKVRF